MQCHTVLALLVFVFPPEYVYFAFSPFPYSVSCFGLLFNYAAKGGIFAVATLLRTSPFQRRWKRSNRTADLN